jgi:hypothetical protein
VSYRNSRDCAIKCSQPLFRAFLRQEILHKDAPLLMGDEAWALIETKEDAAEAVRFIMRIVSRRELDSDPIKGRAWEFMAGRFECWKYDLPI